MTTFKRIVAKNSRIQYWKDGKMVKADILSDDILFRLDTEPEIEISDSPQTVAVSVPDVKRCVFDDEEATKQRYVLGSTYGLCTEDYLHRTTGEIVQKIRENESRTTQEVG